MKRLSWFTAGVITGAVGLYLWMLYEIYSKPVLPTVVEVDSNGYVIEFDDELIVAAKQNFEVISKSLDRFDEWDKWDSASAHDWQGFERSLDDAQPITRLL
jgi:hypothetical protein